MLVAMTVPNGREYRNDVTLARSEAAADLNTSFFPGSEPAPELATSAELAAGKFSPELRGIAAAHQYLVDLNADFANLTFSPRAYMNAVNGQSDSNTSDTAQASQALAA